MLNTRLNSFAELPYTEQGPSYSMYRLLGSTIAEVMGDAFNRWVVEQVIDIEGPGALELLSKALKDLLPQQSPDNNETAQISP